jgi:hypothetical protein
VSEPTLAFAVAVDDLIEFTVSRFERSPKYLKVQRRLRIAFSSVLAGIVATFGLWMDAPFAAAFALPFGLFYYFRYPASSARAVRRHARRVYRGAEADAGVGPQSLRLDGQVLEHTASGGDDKGEDTARVPVWAIEGIDRTNKGVVYIVLGENAAIIIPLAKVTAGDAEAFIAALQSRRPAST